MEPADSIIKALGSANSVGRALNCAASTVWRWTQPVEKGGTGGAIPRKRIRPLLELAREKGIQLDLKDLI